MRASSTATGTRSPATICDRHFGVGADGLILAAASAAADVRMRIFNADGSEAEMSGNGMRCLVKFAADSGIVQPQEDEFDVETGAGVLRVRITTANGRVTAVRESMGRPRLDPREIPIAIEAAPPVRNVDLTSMAGRSRSLRSRWETRTRCTSRTPRWPRSRCNAGAAGRASRALPEPDELRGRAHHRRGTAEMRVWERGVGETLSCGSGASATIVAARLLGLVGDALELRVPGGVLHLEWDGEADVILSGPVEEVFRGTWPD